MYKWRSYLNKLAAKPSWNDFSKAFNVGVFDGWSEDYDEGWTDEGVKALVDTLILILFDRLNDITGISEEQRYALIFQSLEKRWNSNIQGED